MKDKKETRNYLLGKKIPLYLILSLSALGIYGLNYTFKYFHTEEPAKVDTQEAKCVSPLNIIRENDYKLTSPLLLANVKGEDKKYDGIKKQVADYIQSFVKTSVISMASVYYCALEDNSQFSVNKDEKYHPSDRLEIAKMIALLKQSEKNPALLDQKVLYIKQFPITKHGNATVGLENNQFYTIRNLIYDMFANSDKNATLALNPYVDSTSLKNLFSAIQEPFPSVSDKNYMTTITNNSRLLRILYSSGYLSETHSEMALEFLTNSPFKEGILNHLGKEVKVAHYYTENDYGTSKELHEFAIIYLKNKPYLLSIMSKGNDKKNLSVLLSNISKIIYDEQDKIS